MRVAVNGFPIVLFRTADGRAAALKDECAHRHTPLRFGTVVGDRIQCPYHGWTFNAAGEGHAPGQPSLKCGVDAFHAIEKLGYLWVARRSTPISQMPEFVEHAEHLTGAWAGFERMPVIEMTIRSSLGPVIDNFAEIEHVPYVHKILGWDAADAPRMQIQMDNRADGSDALAWGPQREPPNALLKLLDRVLMRRGDTSLLEYGFRFSPVHTIFQPGWGDPVTRERRSFSVRATSVLVPIDDQTTRLINFSFLKLHDEGLRPLRKIVKAAAWLSLRSEPQAGRGDLREAVVRRHGVAARDAARQARSAGRPQPQAARPDLLREGHGRRGPRRRHRQALVGGERVVMQLLREGDPRLLEGRTRPGHLDVDKAVAALRAHGFVLLRGFARGASDFEAITRRFSRRFLIHGNVNRAFVSEDGSTQAVDAGLHPLPLHSEMSYGPFYPDSMWFFCAVPPRAGGETTVCDGVALFDTLAAASREYFRAHRLRYRHRYPPKAWQQGIETTARGLAALKLTIGARLYRKRGDYRFHFDREEHLCVDYVTSALVPMRDGRHAFANSLEISYLPQVIALRGGSVTLEDGAPVSEASAHRRRARRGRGRAADRLAGRGRRHDRQRAHDARPRGPRAG